MMGSGSNIKHPLGSGFQMGAGQKMHPGM